MGKKIKEPVFDSFLRQKKLNEEILKALSLVLESMAEGVNVSNDKGVILYTNPAFDAMFGYNQNELIGKHVSELTAYSQEKNTEMYQEINQVLDEQKAWAGEFSNKRKDGTIFYTEARISAVKLRGKRCLISVQNDSTQRRLLENSLRESETKYRIVSDYTYDWEDWIDPSGTYLYVSPSCERITGYRRDEFVDAELLIKITHPDDRATVENHLREVLSGTSEISHIDFRIITSNGDERWISRYCQSVYSDNGTYLGRRGSNRDITVRKQTEQKLKPLVDEIERRKG